MEVELATGLVICDLGSASFKPEGIKIIIDHYCKKGPKDQPSRHAVTLENEILVLTCEMIVISTCEMWPSLES